MAKPALSGRYHNQYLETTKKNANWGGRERWGQKNDNSEGGLEQILKQGAVKEAGERVLGEGQWG